jgi:hypothetical protein
MPNRQFLQLARFTQRMMHFAADRSNSGLAETHTLQEWLGFAVRIVLNGVIEHKIHPQNVAAFCDSSYTFTVSQILKGQVASQVKPVDGMPALLSATIQLS